MEPNDKSFELRQILCDMNVLTRSDGSAFLVQGMFFFPQCCSNDLLRKRRYCLKGIKSYYRIFYSLIYLFICIFNFTKLQTLPKM